MTLNDNTGFVAPKVTRVEVIDADGRVFARRYLEPGVTVALQDDGRTLKLFAREPEPSDE